MCGIAGIFRADGAPVEQPTLKRMGDAIAHRGPDGEGFYVEDGAPSVGLLNRRLAVIDVAEGTQPITVGDGAYTIVYNGELFNTAELRRELEGAGHRFRTHCDTEVVVRGYAEWGQDVLERLNGMWAFAIWDRDARTLFLARDRLGIKPLVYATVPGGVVFGSEIKAIMASGLIEPEFDPTALPHYLSSFAVPDPMSFFRGVKRLEAGHAMTLTRDGTSIRQYWDCAIEEERDRGAKAYRDEVAELLEDAVGRTMVSDVPLGVLLSGGVDSRLVATYAARATEQLNTFTLGFDDPDADERPAAQRLANQLGADHHAAVMDFSTAADALPKLLAAYDEPGQSLIQTHYVSSFTRRNVTVALSGLGGDELFAAYPTHVLANMLARVEALPGPLRGLLVAGAQRAPARQLRRASELLALSADDRVTHELLHQTPASLRDELLSDQLRGEVNMAGPVDYLVGHLERARAQHPLNRLLYLYLKTYLPNELLRATDAMSMLSSLEIRVPFLDHRLVERAMAIPAHHKMRWRQGKLLLHEIANVTLTEPTSTVKRGFSPPLHTWLRGEFGDQVSDLLAPEAMRRRRVFDPDAVERITRECRAGDGRLVPPLMMVYGFEVWARAWLDGAASAAIRAERPAPPSFATAPSPSQDTAVAAAGAPASGGAADIPSVNETESAAPTPDGEPVNLSVIIVNWKTAELTCAAIRSVGRYLAGVSHEVILVDNDSGDGSPDVIAAEFPDVRMIRNDKNIGFGIANNQGMAVARGRWFLLLNSDAELIDDSVAKLFDVIREQRGVGAGHCRLIFPDGRLQHTTYRFPTIWTTLLDNMGLNRLLPRRFRADLLGGYWEEDHERDVDWVAAAFLFVRREVFEQTGGFDERIFMYGEDMEWCFRIWEAGWRVRFYPQATVKHKDHASSDIRWGDKRVAICLQRQNEIVAERDGRPKAVALMALALTGASMRYAYYRLRSLPRDPGSDRYRVMIPGQIALIRHLLPMLARGR